MTFEEILAELAALGTAQTKKTLLRHGAREPLDGVRISDLQKLRKRIGTDHTTALALYDTGHYDAMYLAAFVADDERMTKAQLRKWARGAYGGSLVGTTVPSVAAGNRHGWALGLEWIDAGKPHVAETGWNTLSAIATVRPDEELDLPAIRKLLRRISKEIHSAPNDVRYGMNGFVIAVGCCVAPLFDEALATAEKIGPVEIDHGETSCQTPFAPDAIRKIESMGRVGRKRRSAKC